MNQEAQEYLDNILKKDPAWLRDDEIDFLNARRDYLTSEQKRVFADVLVQSEEKQEEPENSQNPEKPAKQARKSKSQIKREEVQSEEKQEEPEA